MTTPGESEMPVFELEAIDGEPRPTASMSRRRLPGRWKGAALVGGVVAVGIGLTVNRSDTLERAIWPDAEQVHVAGPERPRFEVLNERLEGVSERLANAIQAHEGQPGYEQLQGPQSAIIRYTQGDRIYEATLQPGVAPVPSLPAAAVRDIYVTVGPAAQAYKETVSLQRFEDGWTGEHTGPEPGHEHSFLFRHGFHTGPQMAPHLGRWADDALTRIDDLLGLIEREPER